ncbi:MAG: hypothetical protein AAFR33_10525, partial [Pseudomonadota bacterium]
MLHAASPIAHPEKNKGASAICQMRPEVLKVNEDCALQRQPAIYCAPFTVMVAPLMKAASSLARYDT